MPICVQSHTLQNALESGQEARIVQIDFTTTFLTSLQLLFKLCLVGIGGSELSVLTQFLPNRSLYAMVNGRRNKLNTVVTGGIDQTRRPQSNLAKCD